MNKNLHLPLETIKEMVESRESILKEHPHFSDYQLKKVNDVKKLVTRLESYSKTDEKNIVYCILKEILDEND